MAIFFYPRSKSLTMAARAAKKKAVPTISGQGFNNPRNPSLQELRSLVVPSFDRAIESVLPETGWQGGLYGAIGLELANDNRSVGKGHFLLFGKVAKPPANSLAAQAAKFWPNVGELKLELFIDNAMIFNFEDSLTSDLIDSSSVPHRFSNGESVLEEDQLEELGIKGFCLRAVIVPTRETFAKISLVILPLPLEDLLNTYPLAENPLFPAISLSALGEFAMGPPAAGLQRPNPWGFPFWPLLVTPTDFSSAPNVPSGTDLRACMGAILRKTYKPEAKNGPAALLKRWEEVKEAGASNLKASEPDKRWPLPLPTPPRG